MTTTTEPIPPCDPACGPEKHLAGCPSDQQATRPLAPSPILRYFAFEHLPHPLGIISSWFHQLANSIDLELPAGPEKTTALRKLLEAKDAAVRAALDL